MKFEKVSFKQFCGNANKGNTELYDDIKLPQRATSGSAGYDFYAPYDFTLSENESLVIRTGIRIELDTNKLLQVYPRSSLGFKNGIVLANTVGIIDSDYYYSDNEGHIMIKLVNRGNKELTIKQGTAFAQGIITEYFTVEDDNATKIRNGGIGSTNE